MPNKSTFCFTFIFRNTLQLLQTPRTQKLAKLTDFLLVALEFVSDASWNSISARETWFAYEEDQAWFGFKSYQVILWDLKQQTTMIERNSIARPLPLNSSFSIYDSLTIQNTFNRFQSETKPSVANVILSTFKSTSWLKKFASCRSISFIFLRVFRSTFLLLAIGPRWLLGAQKCLFCQ